MSTIDPLQALFTDPDRMNQIDRQAARMAILEHRRFGVPMVIGTIDGGVEQVDPFTIDLPPEEAIEPALPG